jgi:hypothetical protein
MNYIVIPGFWTEAENCYSSGSKERYREDSKRFSYEQEKETVFCVICF